jgi:hypothetical protein
MYAVQKNSEKRPFSTFYLDYYTKYAAQKCERTNPENNNGARREISTQIYQ